jgi:hypothetical protein
LMPHFFLADLGSISFLFMHGLSLSKRNCWNSLWIHRMVLRNVKNNQRISEGQAIKKALFHCETATLDVRDWPFRKIPSKPLVAPGRKPCNGTTMTHSQLEWMGILSIPPFETKTELGRKVRYSRVNIRTCHHGSISKPSLPSSLPGWKSWSASWLIMPPPPLLGYVEGRGVVMECLPVHGEWKKYIE